MSEGDEYSTRKGNKSAVSFWAVFRPPAPHLVVAFLEKSQREVIMATQLIPVFSTISNEPTLLVNARDLHVDFRGR